MVRKQGVRTGTSLWVGDSIGGSIGDSIGDSMGDPMLID
jgi:hypothetical protein